MVSNPLEVQVGGTHYISNYQPVELFAKLNLNAFQANVVKYVCRYKRKGGTEDLKKAIHYCELAEQLLPQKSKAYEDDAWSLAREQRDKKLLKEVNLFVETNGLDRDYCGQSVIIGAVVRSMYEYAKWCIEELIEELEFERYDKAE